MSFELRSGDSLADSRTNSQIIVVPRSVPRNETLSFFRARSVRKTLRRIKRTILECRIPERHVNVRNSTRDELRRRREERRATRRKVNFSRVEHTRACWVARHARESRYFSFDPVTVFLPLYSLVKSSRVDHSGYDSKIGSPADVSDGRRTGKTRTYDRRRTNDRSGTLTCGVSGDMCTCVTCL